MEDILKSEDLHVETITQRATMSAFRRQAVQITHLPTGTVARCSMFRSQHQNRDCAMRMLLEALTGR